ncbi:MAG: uroporphyrin-III C-methyltransferase, partial [Blastococcus sp.]|nr:uroporphyrin-III C-methyltransferase [Blastococcus sp.]
MTGMSGGDGSEVVHPVGLRLRGRTVVVVGGGQAAHRQVAGLLAAGAVVTVVSPQVTPALEALAPPGPLTWQRRRYEPGDLDGAWFAVAATDDSGVNREVSEEAERRRIFCARVDDHAASSAWPPAVSRLGDLVGGVHESARPGRAAAVRDAVLADPTDGSTADGARSPVGTGTGCVTLVGGGPGDPGLITVRGHQALALADVVVADHL